MQYITKATCSRMIEFDLGDDDIIHNVRFIGGCNGNTQGISKLIEGMNAHTVVERLEGTDCGGRGTSCPDQLSKAIRLAFKQREKDARKKGKAADAVQKNKTTDAVQDSETAEASQKG